VQGNNIPFSAGNFAATTLVCLADLVPAAAAAACVMGAMRGSVDYYDDDPAESLGDGA